VTREGATALRAQGAVRGCGLKAEGSRGAGGDR